MNKNTLTKTALIAGLVLTPAVIGRYGEPLAEILRPEVLVGFAVVATLVALITLEYGRRTLAPAKLAVRTDGIPATTGQLVAFPNRVAGERAAA